MAPTRRTLDRFHTLPVEWCKHEAQEVQLARYNSSGSSHSILIGMDLQERETQQESPYFACDINVSASVKSSQASRHAHFLRFGAKGITCATPFCTICRGHFRYAGTQSGSVPCMKPFSFEENKAFLWWNKAFLPHSKLVHRWNQFFAISCLIAIFIDPLFFFIFSVRQGFFCIVFDTNYATTITVLRSLTDFIYLLHMLLQFRLAYVVPESQTIGAGDLVTDLRLISWNYLKGSFLVDLIAVLPLPQIMIWIIVPSINKHQANANYTKDLLRTTVLFQYIPRVIRFLPLLFGRSQNGFIFETAWINFMINLLIFILAGHVVGSCWYLFSFQRVNTCLRENCVHEAPSCKPQYLDCGSGVLLADINKDQNHLNWILSSNSSLNCLVNPPFAYGIYASGVPVTLAINPIDKYIYALFWGLLQISTLGGNLVPDYFVWEVLFAMAIIGLGLLLIALLIGNMQNFLQSLGRRQLEMQLRRYDVEAWMKRRGLPKGLKKRVRKAVRFNWAATLGINEEELMKNLPEDLHKQIRRHLCFELVKKVHIFTVMTEEVLDAICERLHQRLYIEDSQILFAGGPVDRMVFIVRGMLETVGSDGSVTLDAGNFCGEELLIWSLQNAGIHTGVRFKLSATKLTGKRPISTRTVRCVTSVEAFSLEAEDLEYVTKYYSRDMRSPRVQGAIRYQSPYFRSWAAGHIQAAWRYQKRKRAETCGLPKMPANRRISSLSHIRPQSTVKPALGHTRSQNQMR